MTNSGLGVPDLYGKQVILNRKAYDLAKNYRASPILIYTYVCDGFTCSALGYLHANKQDSRQKFTESGVEFAQVCEQLQQNFGFCQPQSGVWKKRQNFQNWMQSEDFEDWLKNEEYL